MNPAIISELQARFGSFDPNRFSIIRQPIYDWVRLNTTGTQQIQFMTVPQGGVDPVGSNQKTEEQTNLVMAGSMGQTYYVLKEIRTQCQLVPKNRQAAAAISGDANSVFHGMTANAVVTVMRQFNNLFNQGVLNISFAQKKYVEIRTPLLNAPPGFGVDINQYGASILAADTTRRRFWIRQNPAHENVWIADPVQMIEPMVQMTVTMDFPLGPSPTFTNTFTTIAGASATPTIEIGVCFDGWQIRHAQ